LGASGLIFSKLILGKGLLLAGTGIAIGLILSAISAPMVQSSVWRSSDDVAVFVTVPADFVVVAFLAT